MTNYPKSRWLAASLAVSLPWATLIAQTTQDPEEEIFELSPFTVDASKDDGYRAQSTTAGSRLNTQLKDVAASVTVLTDAFMDDLGATDVATALSMVAGVETELTTDLNEPNLGQGYIGGDFNNPNVNEGSIRVRGLGSATQSANYLEVVGPIDRYNMERTEFLRGPNSLLFGLGKPAGVVNYSTKKAHLSKDINKVDIVLDNFGSKRFVFDFSRAIVEDKLAIRLVGLTSDQQYLYDTAYLDDKRLHVAVAFKPFEGTRIDGYFEDVDLTSLRPNYRIPQDNVSDWLAEFNRAHADAADDGLVTTRLRGEIPLEQYLNENLVWDASWSSGSEGRAGSSSDIEIFDRVRPNPITGELDLRFGGEFRRWMDTRDNGITAYFSPETGWETPIGGQFTSLGNLSLGGSKGPNGGRADRPNARTLFHRSSFGNDTLDKSYIDPQVTDEGIFPFLDNEISVLPGNEKFENNKKVGWNLEQKINDNFYFNATYLKETNTKSQTYAPLAQGHAISIDVNKYLPGSIPNIGDFQLAGNDDTADGLPLFDTLRNEAGHTILDEDGSLVAQDLTVPAGLTLVRQGAYGLASRNPSAENDAFVTGVDNRQPNPNYLRPFFHSRSIGYRDYQENESFLLQANYDLDFVDVSDNLRFLGRHRLTGFMSGNKNLQQYHIRVNTLEYQEGVTSTPEGSDTANRWFTPVYYIGDAVKPGDTSLNITGLPTNTTGSVGNAFPYYGYDTTDNNLDRGEWALRTNPDGSVATATVRNHLNEGNNRVTTVDVGSWGTAVQSFFWENRIVATWGYRKDTAQSNNFLRWDNFNLRTDPVVIAEREARGLGSANADFIRYDIEGDGSDLENDWILDQPQVIQRQTVGLDTKSIVFHAAPWLRLFASESANFALDNPRFDGFGVPIPQQSGSTEEFGFGMSLLEDKLDFKMTFYETKQENEPIGNLRLGGRMNSFEDAVFDVFESSDQRRFNGYTDMPFTIEDWKILEGKDASGALVTVNPGIREPNGTRTVRNKENVNVTQWRYDGDWNAPANVGVTQGSNSKGWELSGTYNASKNLRISANVSRLENRFQNKEAEVLDYIAARTEFWNPLFAAGYHKNGESNATVYYEYELDDNLQPVVFSIPDAVGEPTGRFGYRRYSSSVPEQNAIINAQKDAAGDFGRSGTPESNNTLLVTEFYNRIGTELIDALRDDGASKIGLSEYNARITANYGFKDGRLKGLSFGTNLRWESGKIIGFKVRAVDPSDKSLIPGNFPDPDVNGNGVIDLDEPYVIENLRNDPIEGDPIVTGGLMASYRTKIMGDKVNWRIQLNVDNLFKSGDDLRVTRARPDGSFVYGTNVPTTFKLTNSFDW